MAKFRKKPVEIEAVQFTGDNHDDVLAWMGARAAFTHGQEFFIETLEGDMRAAPGDWIIRGVQGEFYPCKPDIFEATYEAVA